jgi:hypothetical protein
MKERELDYLSHWFASHCDGDWEHEVGIKIATLDNPGWSLNIRIEDTELWGVVVDWTRVDEDDDSWLHWRSTGSMFEARCGPRDLGRALEAFHHFADSATR